VAQKFLSGAGALVKAVFTTSMTRLSTAETSCTSAGRGRIRQQQQRPAHGACGEAACSPMTTCRTRRLQWIDPLLARSLRQPRTLDGGRRARSFLGGVVSTSMYAPTRWRCGRRGSVLPNVALRSVRVLVLVLLRHRGDGGCKLGSWGTGEGRAAGKGVTTGRLPTASLHPGVHLSSPFCLSQKCACSHYIHVHTHISICTHLTIPIPA